MANGRSTDQETIQNAVRAINEHWRGKRYNQIGALLADEVVIAPPGFDRRIRGRSAYVQSYREYDEAVTTLEFSAGETEVDVIGDVAVAVCPFLVVYEIQGTRHREAGHDILVFARSRGEWTVVWRTMQAEAVKENAG